MRLRREFPRLSELRDSAKERGLADFFDVALRHISNTSYARNYYTMVEQDLGALDKRAWKYFQEQLIACLPLGLLPPERRRQMVDKLFEAKGYRYLKEHVGNVIEFIPPSGTKTPELKSIKNGQIVALLEVKTVWRSDDETLWMEENTALAQQGKPMVARRLHPGFPEGLKKKLTEHLKRAESQLKQYPAPPDSQKFVMFEIHLDWPQANTPEIRQMIQNHLKPADSSIKVICEFQGPIFE